MRSESREGQEKAGDRGSTVRRGKREGVVTSIKWAGHKVSIALSQQRSGWVWFLNCSYCQFSLILDFEDFIHNIFVIYHNLATSAPNKRMSLKVSLFLLVIHVCAEIL